MNASESKRLRMKRDQAWHNEMRLLTAGGSDRRIKYWSRTFERLTEKGWKPKRRDWIKARKNA